MIQLRLFLITTVALAFMNILLMRRILYLDGQEPCIEKRLLQTMVTKYDTLHSLLQSETKVLQERVFEAKKVISGLQQQVEYMATELIKFEESCKRK